MSSDKKANEAEQIYPYPTKEEIVLLQHQINKDENHRSRATYNFLRSINDSEEKKWWTMMCYPLLRDKERERLFKD